MYSHLTCIINKGNGGLQISEQAENLFFVCLPEIKDAWILFVAFVFLLSYFLCECLAWLMEVWSFVKGREQVRAVEGESLLRTHALRHILRVQTPKKLQVLDRTGGWAGQNLHVYLIIM